MIHFDNPDTWKGLTRAELQTRFKRDVKIMHAETCHHHEDEPCPRPIISQIALQYVDLAFLNQDMALVITAPEIAFIHHQFAMLNYCMDSYAILDAFRNHPEGYKLAHDMMLAAAANGKPMPGLIENILEGLMRTFKEND